MAESINSDFNSELNQLKMEFEETKSDLEAAEKNFKETRQDLIHVKENLKSVEQELIAARQSRQKFAYQILELFRDFWKFKEKDALLKDSAAFRERILIFLSLDEVRNAVNDLQLKQYEMRGNLPNLEKIETRILQRALKKAEKGLRFSERADQEKAKLNDEKVHKAFVKITEQCLETGDPEEWSMLKEARSNLQKVLDVADKEAEDYLRMKETALKAYTTALTLKGKLSPKMRQLLHEKLQSIMPMNTQIQTQETPNLKSPSGKARNNQTQASPPIRVQTSPKSRKGRSLVHTPIKSQGSRKPADIPEFSSFGLTDLLSVGELMKLMKDPAKTPAVSTHITSKPVTSPPNAQQCHKLFNNLYDQIKSQLINPSLCDKILSTSAEARERVVMNQMVKVLTNFLQEKQNRNL